MDQMSMYGLHAIFVTVTFLTPPTFVLCQLCLPKLAALGSCADICGRPDSPPQLRAPLYGLLFTQMAIASLPQAFQAR